MKASELRIGNIVYFNDNDVHTITGRDILDLDLYPLDDSFTPIPLSEQWLVKFGFEEVERYGKGVWMVHDFILIFYPDECLLCDCDIDVKIKHVHQLQNLYFALTGEEL